MKVLSFLFFHFFVTTRAIYYGNKIPIDNIPYVVLLKNENLFCSGALISDRHVLTAAHCVRGNQTVFIGTDHFYQHGNTNQNVQVFTATKFWAHEKFSLPSAVYDVGVVELPTPITFSKDVQKITVSTKRNVENDAEDLEVVTAGFGYSENTIGATQYLYYARMKMIPLAECKNHKPSYVEDLNENHICMTSIKGQPCDGDSGAPVISTKTRELVGIISYVKDAEGGESIDYNDCEASTPTVATRVSSYLDWINEKTGLNLGGEEVK